MNNSLAAATLFMTVSLLSIHVEAGLGEVTIYDPTSGDEIVQELGPGVEFTIYDPSQRQE